MIIHLDMDGVLANFELGFELKTGKSLHSFESPKEFWKFANGYQDLYADLPVMHDAHVLVDFVMNFAHRYNHEIEILTAVPILTNMPLVPQHKQEWINYHFPYGWKFKIGPYSRDKQHHAKPGDVLIDDKSRNIDQWKSAGGTGILHISAHDTIRQIKNIFGQ